ncbi:MAG TPA: hypothetical protein VFO29_11895 [Candidatus Rubrimentiphilum sp.]|nr:hypothetical protein [Candidatus Rubrimentiphilum sp.]
MKNEDGLPMVTTAEARAEVREDIERLKDTPYWGSSTYEEALHRLDVLESKGVHAFVHLDRADLRASIRDECIRVAALERERAEAIEAAEAERKDRYVERIREARTAFFGKDDLRPRDEIEKENAAIITANAGTVTVLTRDRTLHKGPDHVCGALLEDNIREAVLEAKEQGVGTFYVGGQQRQDVMCEMYKLEIVPENAKGKDREAYADAVRQVEHERAQERAQIREAGRSAEMELEIG